MRKRFFTPLTAFGLALIFMSGMALALTEHPPSKWGKNTQKILLVGNNLASYNNTPRILKKMLNDGSDKDLYYEITSYVKPGYTLANHNWKRKYAWKVYNDRPDIVLLQEHSSTIFYKNERDDSINAINHMVKVARYYGAAPRLLQTWPRGGRNDFYGEKTQTHENVIKVKNPDEMAKEQIKYHEIMASKNHIANIRTSAAWQCMNTHHPGINLYQKDDNTPTIFGSYLMAVGIYRSIHGQLPNSNTWTPSEVSSNIKSKIFDCVTDSINTL